MNEAEQDKKKKNAVLDLFPEGKGFVFSAEQGVLQRKRAINLR